MNNPYVDYDTKTNEIEGGGAPFYEKRPWGSFTILDEGADYKVKRIEVLPGQRLSLQKHLYRDESWIVVSGEAIVNCDGTKVVLKKNDNIFIPVGAVHRAENSQLVPLVFIEIQNGEYCGEDDIIRLEDDYSRV